MRRIVRIPTTLAMVIAAYWAYAMVAVPRIEPPPRPRPASTASTAPLTATERLGLLCELFRPQDWELEPKTKVIESEQVKFLVQDYSSAPDSPTLVLDHCTIIFTPNGASSVEAERLRQAVVLQAEKGAVLEFDQPFDLRGGSIGRLVSGRLDGKIVIRSPGKLPGPEDDLYALTRDIQLNEQKVWTSNPIEFSLGRSTGRGSEMEIKFVPGDAVGTGKGHGLNVGGIESVEVRRLERLHIEPSSTNVGARHRSKTSEVSKTAPGKPPLRAAEHAADSPIEVTCRGPFRFDLGQQQATFEDRVELQRLHPNGPSDQIQCELLAIQFAQRREATSPPGAKPDAAAKTRGGLPDLEARSVEAKGNPVVVLAPGQQVEARGEYLRYDLQKNSIVIEGGQEVSLRQAANEIRARKIEYTVGAAGRLGEAFAVGPGWVRGQMNGTMRQPLHAQWRKHLSLRPDKNSQHLISLVGEAEMNYGALGRLQAPEIHFWLNEVALGPGAAGGPEQRSSLQPDRMLAGDLPSQGSPNRPATSDRTLRAPVRMHAAQLNGAVGQLEVWFESSLASAPRGPGQPRATVAPQASDLQSPSPFAGAQQNPAVQLARQFPRMARTAWRLATDDNPLTTALLAQAAAGTAVGPQAMSGAAPNAGPAKGVALGRQFQIEGGLLRARVAGLGEHAEVTELIVEGNVRFVETQTAQAGDKPVAVTGDRIHVVDAGKPHAAVGVAGNPARFDGRGLVLEGSNLNLNAGTNRLWIDGPGRLELLMDRDLEGRPIARVGSETQPTGPMVVRWQERMVMDGRTVRFDESVVATAAQQQLRTETLEVAFRNEIRFSDPKQASQPEVERLTCRGRVLLEGRETEGPVQTAVERVDVTDLSLNRVTGEIRASGPGRVVSVRRKSEKMPALAPGGPVQPGADAAGPRDAAKPLVYLDVQFQREITGNLLQRQMEFHEQVRTICVPVDSWDAKFNDDNPDLLGPHGVILRCDRLKATQLSPPGSAVRAWGLDASDNVRAEGQAFTAQCVRMTFDQPKGLLVLEGDGRSDATIFLEGQPGQGRTAQQSQRILYWPETKRVKLEGFRSLQIPSLPGGNKK